MTQEKETVLLVDDDEQVRTAMVCELAETELKVVTAVNAAEGLQLLAEQGPIDVVVADFRMPGMNGVELAREVRKRWPSTICVMVTGYSDAAAVHEAAEEKLFVEILAKPWRHEEFINTIYNAAARSRLYRENFQSSPVKD